MRRFILVATLPWLGGCDVDPEKAFDVLTGRETNLVILSPGPVTLKAEALTLTSQQPMKVIGESTFLCFALGGGVPLQNSKNIDTAFDAAMRGAKVRVEVVLASGTRVALRQPLQAWSMYGKIVKNDELSACASTPCKAELPAGAQVSKIEVSAEPNLYVQGVYWESARSPNEEPSLPTTTAAASSQKSKSKCTA